MRIAALVALSVCALPGAAALAAEAPAAEKLAVLDVASVHEAPSTIRVGDRLLFAGRDWQGGVEPWITDGTAAGTRRILDVVPGPASSSPRFVGTAGRFVVCMATTLRGVVELVAFDPDEPTAASLLPVGDEAPGTRPMRFASAGDRLVFTADPYDVLETLWATDGTPEGTRPLEAAPARVWSALASLGDRALFFSGVGAHTPWVTDGTEEGTHPLAVISPNAQNALASADVFLGVPYAVAGNSVIYAGDGGVWATDGRPGRARLVVPQDRVFGGPFPRIETRDATAFLLDSRLRLTAVDGAAPWGFRTLPFRAGRDEASAPAPLAASGRRVFASVREGRGDARRLWSAQGRSARPVRARDGRRLEPPTGRTIAAGDAGLVAFTGPATDGVGAELWISDGSRRGTRLLADVAPGPESSNADPLAVVGGRVLCVADDLAGTVRRLVSVELP